MSWRSITLAAKRWGGTTFTSELAGSPNGVSMLRSESISERLTQPLGIFAG